MKIEREAKKRENTPFQVHFFWGTFCYETGQNIAKLAKRLAARGSNAKYVCVIILGPIVVVHPS